MAVPPHSYGPGREEWDAGTRQIAGHRFWLLTAINLSRRCPPSPRAYSVGAVIVNGAGLELARGHSRESDSSVHAEEAALAKLDPRASLAGAVLYSSMEPCSRRSSRPRSCTELILDSGIRRVVFGLREPPLFVRCDGIRLLREAGVEVLEMPELADRVVAANGELLGRA